MKKTQATLVCLQQFLCLYLTTKTEMKFDHRTLTTAMDFQKTKMKHNSMIKKKKWNY